MRQEGKIHNPIQELTRMKLDIHGISEMRWPGFGEKNSAEHTILCSGTSTGENEQDAGMIVTIKMDKCISKFLPLSQLVMSVQFLASSVNKNIIQVYALTADYAYEGIQEFYKSINDIIMTLKI